MSYQRSYLLRGLSRLLAVSLVVLFRASTRAQDTCNFPTSVLPEYGGFFSSEQEMDFGDIVAEQLQRNFHVAEAVELTGYPRRIVDRIVAQLPENSVHFRVYLFDLPTANAFSLPGGCIYISRKMVAFLRNEDELAGLLGHEMGHILSHQEAVNATRMFSYILGVTSVGDRDDIFEKYNELLNKEAGRSDYLKIMAREEEPQQYQADQIALYLLASAGYSPQSFIDYLRSVALAHDGDQNREAIRTLERSVGLDSMYAPAWSALGMRYYYEERSTGTERPEPCCGRCQRSGGRCLWQKQVTPSADGHEVAQPPVLT